MTSVTLEPMGRTEGLERLDLLDLDQIHDAVQRILRAIDPQLPGAQAHPGRNAGRSWLLFSYRTFESETDSRIDPVVVGVNLSRGNQGVLVRGDISGELSGDLLIDVPAREFLGAEATKGAAESVAKQLLSNAEKIRGALTDARRRC